MSADKQLGAAKLADVAFSSLGTAAARIARSSEKVSEPLEGIGAKSYGDVFGGGAKKTITFNELELSEVEAISQAKTFGISKQIYLKRRATALLEVPIELMIVQLAISFGPLLANINSLRYRIRRSSLI